MTNQQPQQHAAMIETGEATAILPVAGGSVRPITVIGTPAIRGTFDDECLRQALNTRLAPGVEELVLNPDAHCGYGAPVGCVVTSPTHIYPGPVGVDIKCSMSLLQLDLPAEAVADRRLRRALIDAIGERVPTGAGQGQRSVKKARHVGLELGRRAVVEGASPTVCEALGVPPTWAAHCEDACHSGHDGSQAALDARLERLLTDRHFARFESKVAQLGSYGGGNHFGECEIVSVEDNVRARQVAATFGLIDGGVAFLSHCGSRGFGHLLATGQFKTLERHFEKWSIPLPGGDRQLVYAPLGSPEADAYLDDMALGANFATVNHLLINALVLEAFQQILPGTTGRLVYFISHNIALKNGLATYRQRQRISQLRPHGQATPTTAH
jgi:tRNA-splicing ligase RtcB (3'-phosphate/5'-hydroxy nucleic acid ligase)